MKQQITTFFIITLPFIGGMLLMKNFQLPHERYISLQTVELKGDIYVCGTVNENRDKDSLYCTGFTDGYSWAVNQMNLDEELHNEK